MVAFEKWFLLCGISNDVGSITMIIDETLI